MRETFLPQTQNNEQIKPVPAPTANMLGKSAIGLVDDPEEARAMAEAHDVIHEHTQEIIESEDWDYYSESQKANFLSSQERKTANAEKWASALYKLPENARSSLNDLGDLARWQIQGLAPLGRFKKGEVTVQDLVSMEEKIIYLKDSLEKDAAEISKRSLFDQVRILSDRLKYKTTGEYIPTEYGSAIPEHSQDAIDSLANDPNTTLKDLAESIKHSYMAYGTLPVENDIATQEKLLQLIEGGNVPQLKELEEAAPYNHGLIAQQIRSHRQRTKTSGLTT